MLSWKPSLLSFDESLESKNVLKQLTSARSALAELKGVAISIPNQSILINTLSLQEAKDSSAIENIVTTHDELYKSGLESLFVDSLYAKEVQNYAKALRKGVELLSTHGFLSQKHILRIQEILEENKAGYRKVPGTHLKDHFGKTVYTPPQTIDEIQTLINDLESFINTSYDYDPIVKMAVVHFQFESIHPFYDGNGRTGRIINILLLMMEGLLDLPILYLSQYIIRNKENYYKLLQEVREKNNWENWLLYMIKGVEETALETIKLIKGIQELMMEHKHIIREQYKFYSQDLLNHLYKHPYTKIDFLVKDLNISRITAANYLNKMAKDGLLKKEKIGVANYYINHALFDLLSNR